MCFSFFVSQIVRHGGALGLGLAALGTARQDVYDLLKSNLYQDDAVTGRPLTKLLMREVSGCLSFFWLVFFFFFFFSPTALFTKHTIRTKMINPSFVFGHPDMHSHSVGLSEEKQAAFTI